MKMFWRAIKIVVAGGLLLAVLALAAGAGLRSYNQSVNAKRFVIQTSNGIDEGAYVSIGGIDQWVQIRGQDRANPVILAIHGGPGGTWIPLTEHFIPWEKHFTIVLWDQRGAGKTLGSTGAAIADTMSIERMAQDGLEVAEHVRTHLKKDKLILLAHSWGSILGIHMVKRRPELFHAYVGTGQVADLPRSLALATARLQQEAQAANDRETLGVLGQIGQPPFDTREKIAGYFGRMDAYAPAEDQAAMAMIGRKLLAPAPNYSLGDEFDRFRGFLAVPTLGLYTEMLGTRLATLGPAFNIPMIFIQGANDRVTQAAVAEDYFRAITAPHKDMVVIEGGHFAFLSNSERFFAELKSRVLPIVANPAAH